MQIRNSPKSAEPPKGSETKFPIVGVGASAGGLEAFTQLLKHLPTDTRMGFVLVQHLDPDHGSALTQLLARATALPVQEVSNKLRVKSNHVYVIPPNTSLSIANGVLKLEPRQQGAQRVIDFFFDALARDQKDYAIGVILSGTATDGTMGLEAIKGEGGITFAQDESAKYDSMPRSAVAAGCVDFVLSPENIARELARIAQHPLVGGEAHLRAPLACPAGRPAPLKETAAQRNGRQSKKEKRPPFRTPSRRPARVGRRRSPNKTASKRFSSCCAIIPAWISRSTNLPPSSGAFAGAWCSTSRLRWTIMQSSCAATRSN